MKKKALGEDKNALGRKAALDSVMDKINKTFGKNSIMLMGEDKALDIEVCETGSVGLDIALGAGGLPYGRIIEIYGPESSGKTTLTLSLIAKAQKNGKTCAFIDAEHALDPVYASKLGVSIDELYLSQPDTGEEGLNIAECLASSGAVDMIIIDSVAALTPKAEIEGEIGDSHMGLQARMMSQALRKITAIAKQNNCMVVFINQLRMKIGVMFGNPETTTGGNALKFYASVRLDIRRTGSIKDGDDVVGNTTKVKVIKNKIAPPFKETNFNIMFGKGIDVQAEYVEFGVSLGIFDKKGAWYSYNGTNVAQGAANLKEFLMKESNAHIVKQIKDAIAEKYLSSKVDPSDEE